MKILICDDHKIVRDGLKQIVQQLKGVTHIAEAGSGNEAFSQLKNQSFEIMLLDISMPDMNGLEILKTVKATWPSTNVLMLSMHPQEQYAIRALKLGASGYLTKDTATEELLIAIKSVFKGGKYISLSFAENIVHHIVNEPTKQKHDQLSLREFEILIKLANGISLQEIGKELFISSKTVSTYRSRIMEKMAFTRNTELTKYCIETKLI
jgi:two-component system, NarL family, invasion response regulator UvrY